MKMITKALLVLGLAVGAVGVAGVGSDAEAKKKNKYDVKVKFCGLTGPSSNFSKLKVFDDNRTIQTEFNQNKDLIVLVSSFNGKDRVRATARRIKGLSAGEQRNFKCNEKKGGCRFRVRLAKSSGDKSMQVKYNSNGKHLYYGAPTRNFGPFKDRNLVIKITQAKLKGEAKTFCSSYSRSSFACKYYFDKWDVSISPGSSC